MKIGDVIRFTERAGRRKGKVFLVLNKDYMRDAGGYAYDGVELPEWDAGNDVVPPIPFPWFPTISKNEMGIWDEWQSKDQYELITTLPLVITSLVNCETLSR